MRNAIAQALKLGLVVLVVAGLALSGLALAQVGDDTEPATAVPTQSPAESQAQEEPADEADDRPRFRRFHRIGNVLGIAAETIGIDPSALFEQLQEDGATIASVAAANGSSSDEVVAAVVEDLTKRLDEAVADERLTREEADERLADATARITEAVNSETPIGPRDGFGRRGPHLGLRGNIEAVAEVLDLTVDDLAQAREDGTTLSELADQQGVAVDDLVAVMVAPLQERLAEDVAAERLTQEEADEKLAEATARITEFIETGEKPEGPCGPGHRHGPGRGFRGGPGNRSGAALFGSGPAAGQDVIDA